MDAISRQGHNGSHRLGVGLIASLLLSWLLLGVALAQQPELERARQLLARRPTHPSYRVVTKSRHGPSP